MNPGGSRWSNQPPPQEQSGDLSRWRQDIIDPSRNIQLGAAAPDPLNLPELSPLNRHSGRWGLFTSYGFAGILGGVFAPFCLFAGAAFWHWVGKGIARVTLAAYVGEARYRRYPLETSQR